MTEKDQAAKAEAEGQSEEKETLDSLYDKGWEQVELLTQNERAAAAKPEEEAGGEKKTGEEAPPPTKPFKVLKVQGKEIPVMTEAEYETLAMKGLDYTKKTQSLADDRRAAESEFKSKEGELGAQIAKANELLDRMIASGIIPANVGKAAKKAAAEAGEEAAEGEGTPTDEDAAVFKRFGLDPQNAYPHEKAMVRSLSELESEIQQIRLERAQAKVDQAIAEERENFPYEDVKNDQGEDLTQQQITAMVMRRKQASGLSKPTVDQVVGWAREAVRELHDIQRKGAASDINDDTDPLEFAKRYPKLAKALRGNGSEGEGQATKRADVPPAVKPSPRASDLTRKKAVSPSGKSMEDYLEAGFADPDIIKALNPQ